MLLKATKEITMKKPNLKTNWSLMKNEANTRVKKNLQKMWGDFNPKFRSKKFYIDRSAGRYMIDVDGFTKQPVEHYGEKYDSGTRFPVKETGILRLGVAWRSRIQYDLGIFGCFDRVPGTSLPGNGSHLVHECELVGVGTERLMGSDPTWYKAEAIDLDISALKDIEGTGDNQVHIGFNVFNPLSGEKTITKEDLDIVFFVETSRDKDRVLRYKDSEIKLNRYLMEDADMVFSMGDIVSPNNFAASFDCATGEVILHNRPLPDKPEYSIKLEDLQRDIVRSNSQLSVKDMFEVVIPPENITSNPDEADVLVTDIEQPDGSKKEVLDPEYDMQEIKELLMV